MLVNLRLSFDRLSGLVSERMERSARSSALFVFFNRHRTILKAVFFDGTGLCIFFERLDKGRFRLPEPIADGQVVELSERELDDLLDGIDIERRPPKTVHSRRYYRSIGMDKWDRDC